MAGALGYGQGAEGGDGADGPGAEGQPPTASPAPPLIHSFGPLPARPAHPAILDSGRHLPMGIGRGQPPTLSEGERRIGSGRIEWNQGNLGSGRMERNRREPWFEEDGRGLRS
jgi:hypothetical protein